jgi:hypothetical protein
LTHRVTVTTMTDVSEVLDLLESEERSVSRQRTQLHRRIDFLHSGGYAHMDTVPEMQRLRDVVRGLSERRRTLHAQIEAARSERQRRRRGGT